MQATTFFLQLLLGDLNGMLLLVPVGLVLALRRDAPVLPRTLVGDLAFVLLPTLLAYALVVLIAPRHVYFYATAMCALPILYFAQRAGWRGVAISFPPASIAVAMASIASGNTELATQVQLFLVVVGVASLLLGASVDELSARNRSLELVNARLDATSDELRDAAAQPRHVGGPAPMDHLRTARRAGPDPDRAADPDQARRTQGRCRR